MSIRIDASGDYARRTAALPSDTLFTILGWMYLVSDRTGIYRYFAGIENNVASSTQYKLLGLNNTDQFQIASEVTVANFTTGPTPTNSTWYKFALLCNGTGAGSLVAYIQAIGGTLYNQSVNSAAMTEAVLYLGNDSYDEWNNIRLANIKVYEAALSQAEISIEWNSFRPIRYTNLHAWWPMLGGASERLRDYSGAAKTLTSGGTLTDEANPPLAWNLGMANYRKKSVAPASSLIPVIQQHRRTQGSL